MKRKGGGKDTFTRVSLIKYCLFGSGLLKQCDDADPDPLSLSSSGTREDLRSVALNHQLQTGALIVLKWLENKQLFLHLTHPELSLCFTPINTTPLGSTCSRLKEDLHRCPLLDLGGILVGTGKNRTTF